MPPLPYQSSSKSARSSLRATRNSSSPARGVVKPSVVVKPRRRSSTSRQCRSSRDIGSIMSPKHPESPKVIVEPLEPFIEPPELSQTVKNLDDLPDASDVPDDPNDPNISDISDVPIFPAFPSPLESLQHRPTSRDNNRPLQLAVSQPSYLAQLQTENPHKTLVRLDIDSPKIKWKLAIKELLRRCEELRKVYPSITPIGAGITDLRRRRIALFSEHAAAHEAPDSSAEKPTTFIRFQRDGKDTFAESDDKDAILEWVSAIPENQPPLSVQTNGTLRPAGSTWSMSVRAGPGRMSVGSGIFYSGFFADLPFSVRGQFTYSKGQEDSFLADFSLGEAMFGDQQGSVSWGSETGTTRFRSPLTSLFYAFGGRLFRNLSQGPR
ncbi:uncharacterized protein BO97DRAFT_425100 [Aspergillus homomorphus CBS 101889]|uniref:Uncharacterized protein n=1 Tax=Aspergillus homomorphus (strain CBS 101889) TaxID=1450537 RepID=A0A395HV50_ASPHC|nr:hypothetical protein BO97DRAFT_425100 [Aspergillus homomorphus CBS 101889]RAL11801.1 hypothetical protein BO97DRAFT_425100 [Aspergillus homomorphus CBS 101889]